MKSRNLLINLIMFFSGFAFVPAQESNGEQVMGNESLANVNILSASFGPLAAIDTWEKYSFPLNASTFGIQDADFQEAMKSIQFIRIRTELNSGSDIGSIDSVTLGDAFESTFDTDAEGWSAMGDGSLYWEAEGGMDGGFISVADESRGDWHWAVAPTTWSGDLTSQIGKNFSFYVKTNSSGYNGVVELHTVEIQRIVLSVEKNEIKAGETATLKVNLSPAPITETKIKIAATNAEYFNFDTVITVAAGVSETNFNVKASENIAKKIKGNFTASASGYNASSVTVHIALSSEVDHAMISNLQLYPNPASEVLMIERESSETITIEIYNTLGQKVYNSQGSRSLIKIGVNSFTKGRYIIKLNTEGTIVTRSFVVN